jgi:primary-amine oxidase
LIDYIFYLDGTFEVKVRASEYIQGAYGLNSTQSEYSYRFHDSFSSSVHDHVLNFKADIDIGVLTVAEKQTQYSWLNGQTINTMPRSALTSRTRISLL